MSENEVTGIDVEGVELVNVQVGNTLFRDGGPYGDQSDAIRDEKVNAAREGRAPNFDSLIPIQYKLAPKEEVRESNLRIESQRTEFLQETLFIAEESPYEKSVRSHPAKTVETSKTDEPQADSQNVAKALFPDDEFKDL